MEHQFNGEHPFSTAFASSTHTDEIRSTFYYPMTGLINLFIHILRFPVLSTAQSDIALLDIIAGHFAHMEFVTGSELKFPFARNVAALARQTVDKASQASSPILHGGEHVFDLHQEMELPSQVRKPSLLDLIAFRLTHIQGIF